jgi:hypothetical protein
MQRILGSIPALKKKKKERKLKTDGMLLPILDYIKPLDSVSLPSLALLLSLCEGSEEQCWYLLYGEHHVAWN